MSYAVRSRSAMALIAAAALAAAASSAHAAFSYSVAADNSSQQTTYIFPTFQTTTTSPGPLYTTFGPPVVTNSAGIITLNFSTGLSAAFASQADGNIIIEQSTDGHLVLDVHFDTSVSISVALYEGGVYNTTGNGSVSVNGGAFAVEAVDPLPVESQGAAILATFNSGVWSGSATTLPFNGLYTDYQIAIDNDLVATATDGSAFIAKKDFILQIIPGGGSPPTPEPASLSLLALGAGALLFRRRKHA